QALPGPGAGRLPGLLAADGVRPGGAAQPGVPEGRPRAALPLLLPQQQPGDERPAEELFLARVLRPCHRPDALLVLLEDDRQALPGDARVLVALDERGA